MTMRPRPSPGSDHAFPQPGGVAPQSGRLCRRAVAEGAIWVGILALPPEFVPVEGVAYALLVDGAAVRVLTAPLDGGLDSYPFMRGESFGLTDLVSRPIWPKPAHPSVVSVRFLAAFPEHNHWTVYGPTPHTPPEADAPHRWWDVGAKGALTDIEPPVNATGMGVAQILTSAPVWPGPDGDRYTLPQTPTAWRPDWLAYHELLAHASRTHTEAGLRADLARRPRLRGLNLGQPDAEFCAYLTRLQDAGLLTEDRPQKAAELERRMALVFPPEPVNGAGIPDEVPDPPARRRSLN